MAKDRHEGLPSDSSYIFIVVVTPAFNSSIIFRFKITDSLFNSLNYFCPLSAVYQSQGLNCLSSKPKTAFTKLYSELGKGRRSTGFMRFLLAFLWFLSEQYYRLNVRCLLIGNIIFYPRHSCRNTIY